MSIKEEVMLPALALGVIAGTKSPLSPVDALQKQTEKSIVAARRTGHKSKRNIKNPIDGSLHLSLKFIFAATILPPEHTVAQRLLWATVTTHVTGARV